MWRSRLWLLPLLLAVVVAGGRYFAVQHKAGDRELPVYVRGGARMAHGEEIYRVEPKAHTYPPFAALLFVPMAALPEAWQPPLWFLICFSVLVPVVVWLHRWAGRPRAGAGPPRRALLWLLAALVAGRFVASVFENQSHDVLVLGFVALGAAAWCRGGRGGALVAGAGWGAGAAFKATPLLFVELLTLRRAWLGLGALVAVALALSLLPDLLLPRADGGSWLSAWLGYLSDSVGPGRAAGGASWGSHSVLNQSLSGMLTRLFQPVPPAVAAAAFVEPDVLLTELPAAGLRALVIGSQLVVLGAIGLGVLRARRLAAAGDDRRRQVGLGEAALVVCGMLLLSPQSSKAHFCVLLLPAVFLADRVLRGPRDRLLWVLLVAAAALSLGTAKGLVGSRAGSLLLGYGAVTWLTSLLLVCCLRALRSPRPAAAARSADPAPAPP